MKTGKLFLIFNFLLCCLLLTGCNRTKHDVWEDSKTAGRHVNRGFRALMGKNVNSRQIKNRDQFMPMNSYGYHEDEFIPLRDERYSNEIAMNDMPVQQPREFPGDFGSSIPGIEAFKDPSTDLQLSGTFQNIHFEYNSSLVKGQNNLDIARRIANYMKKNPYVYIFVEGHCDENGPEAYNFALGARRSNAVRNLLIGEGVNPDNVFTISYGKERPLVFERNEEAWRKNRRAEFKVYER